MTEFKDGSVSTLARALRAAGSDVADTAFAQLPYVPGRHIPSAAARPRDITLPLGFIKPCLPMIAPSAPSEIDWLHEIKHDGLRIIARWDGQRVRLYGRDGNDLTRRFPLIVNSVGRLPPCTIDGEAIACDANGVPSFDLLRGMQHDARVFLYAFDLIELGGKDRRRDQLIVRKRELGQLLADAGPGVLPTQWIDGRECNGRAVFEHACASGLEGIVSKRKHARYMSGRSPYWLKMVNPESAAARRKAHAAAEGVLVDA